MEKAIQIFALVQLLLMGVSHIVKREAWAEFFIQLSEKGHPGVFLHGFLSLWFGAIIVGFHQIWEGPALVLTMYGWLMILKASHCFLFPEMALRSLRKVRVETSWEFIPAGILFLLVSCSIAYELL